MRPSASEPSSLRTMHARRLCMVPSGNLKHDYNGEARQKHALHRLAGPAPFPAPPPLPLPRMWRLQSGVPAPPGLGGERAISRSIMEWRSCFRFELSSLHMPYSYLLPQEESIYVFLCFVSTVTAIRLSRAARPKLVNNAISARTSTVLGIPFPVHWRLCSASSTFQEPWHRTPLQAVIFS